MKPGSVLSPEVTLRPVETDRSTAYSLHLFKKFLFLKKLLLNMHKTWARQFFKAFMEKYQSSVIVLGHFAVAYSSEPTTFNSTVSFDIYLHITK